MTQCFTITPVFWIYPVLIDVKIWKKYNMVLFPRDFSIGFRFSHWVIFLNKSMILKSPLKIQIFYLGGVAD